MVQVDGKLSPAFSRSIPHGCPLFPLLYPVVLEPLLLRLRNEASSPTLFGIAVHGGGRTSVSAYTHDLSNFLSYHSDIEVVQKAFERHEKVTRTNINRNKSLGLRLDAWDRSRGSLLGLTDSSAFLECGSISGSSWRRIGQRYRQWSECWSGFGPDSGSPLKVGLRPVPLMSFQ